MADDQHPDTDAAEESERPTPRRGLDRFASRFRREHKQPEADASLEPTPADAPWLSPLDRTSPGPEPLARELDLTLTPRRTPAPLQPESKPQLESKPQHEAQAYPEAASPSDAPQSEPDPAARPTGPQALDEQPDDDPPDDDLPDDLTDDERPGATAETPVQPLSGSARAPESVPIPPRPTPAPTPTPVEDTALSPVLTVAGAEFDEEEEEDTGPRTRAVGVSAHLAVLTAVATSIIMAFLLIEPSPRWLLLLGAAAVVFGLDGTLRQTWRAPFSLGQETAPFLFVPALYIMAVPVLIEHNVSGELVFLVGLGAGFGFGALAWAEIASVRARAAEYDQARVIVTANTYLTGFAIFSLSYVFDISLLAAIVATSMAAAMLAVEVLREGEIDPMETLGLALVTGVIIGEARWLLYYIPLDTYLAGLTLLLVFYLATGLLHSHVIRALNRVVAVEYSAIAAAGLALVILARAVGLA